MKLIYNIILTLLLSFLTSTAYARGCDDLHITVINNASTTAFIGSGSTELYVAHGSISQYGDTSIPAGLKTEWIFSQNTLVGPTAQVGYTWVDAHHHHRYCLIHVEQSFCKPIFYGGTNSTSAIGNCTIKNKSGYNHLHSWQRPGKSTVKLNKSLIRRENALPFAFD